MRRHQVELSQEGRQPEVVGLLSQVFSNVHDERIPFFLDHLTPDFIRELVSLRNSAFQGTVFEKQKKELNSDTFVRPGIPGRNVYGHILGDSPPTLVEDIEIMLQAVLPKESNIIKRAGFFSGDTVLSKHRMRYYGIPTFASVSAALIGLLVFVVKTATEEEKMLHALGIFFLLMGINICYAFDIRQAKNISLMKSDFNDSSYDQMLAQLCESEGVEHANEINWSLEIQVNNQPSTLRKLTLCLLASFNRSMHGLIFSTLLPGIIAGEEHIHLTRALNVDIDVPNRRQQLCR